MPSLCQNPNHNRFNLILVCPSHQSLKGSIPQASVDGLAQEIPHTMVIAIALQILYLINCWVRLMQSTVGPSQ